MICVVKKNAVVLRKLIAWLSEASQQLESIPALVIDDEADQAGVATNDDQPADPLAPRRAPEGRLHRLHSDAVREPAHRPELGRPLPEGLHRRPPQAARHFGTERIFGREPLDGRTRPTTTTDH